MNRKMSYKKVLPLVAVGLLLLSVFVVPSFAPPPTQPPSINEIINMLEKIMVKVKDIHGWFDPQGGTYSKTPQIETGGWNGTITKDGYHNVYEPPPDGRPAYKITITIYVENVGPTEEIYYAFHLGPIEGRREFSYLILAGEERVEDRGLDPTTNEFCVNGWEPFQLFANNTVDGFDVWYNYVVMYEP